MNDVRYQPYFVLCGGVFSCPGMWDVGSCLFHCFFCVVWLVPGLWAFVFFDSGVAYQVILVSG